MSGDRRARALPRLAQPVGVGQQLVDPLGEPLDVAGRHEHEPIAGGRDLLGSRLAATAYGRHAGGHRLDVGHPKGLLGGGHHEECRAPGLLERLLRWQLPAEVDPLGDSEPDCEPLERSPLRSFADDHVAQRGMALTEHGERTQDVGMTLAGDEMAHGHEARRVAPHDPASRALRRR